ncbi:MAG: hypothetical protein ACK5RS_03955, partial [Acidobacteriota bacterium]
DQGAVLHRQCGGEIANLGVDLLIGVRGLARELVDGAVETGRLERSRTRFYETTDEAATSLPAILGQSVGAGDLVLVKGSRGVRMERIVERLRSTWE